ncbi:MAG: hypothetical protein IJX13_06375, partial [Clostridia bacterium]|nr:hypothetical protein [Clostridia bacterium]
MKTKKRKYISIILCSLALFLVAVGFSTWIILSEQTGSILPFIIRSNLEVSAEPTVKLGTGINALFVGETEMLVGDGKTPNYSIKDANGKEITVSYIKDGDTTGRKIPGTWTWTPKGNTPPSAASNDEKLKSDTDTVSGYTLYYIENVPCTLTFTPSGIYEYLFNGYTFDDVQLNLYAVALWDSDPDKTDDVNTYYTTVDAALAAANGNGDNGSGTVYALPSGDYTNIESTRAKTAKTISSTKTIASGVTLCLPYGYENGNPLATLYAHRYKKEADGTTYVPDGNYRQDIVETFKNTDNAEIVPAEAKKLALTAPNNNNAYSDKSTYCKNVVTLDSQLQVNGTLDIRGIYYSGINNRISGQTFDAFACFTIGKGALTINKYLECFGFIDYNQTHAGFDRITFTKTASLLMPFVFYDWRGGSSTLAMLDANVNESNVWGAMTAISKIKNSTFITSPILRFVFPNIVGNYTIIGGAVAKARAVVHFSSSNETTLQDIVIVSAATGSFIQLYENASLQVSYADSKIDGVFGKMTLHFYGGASLNAFSITVALGDISSGIISGDMNLSSEGKFLPISYFYDVYFHGEGAIYDLTNQKVKLFPGSNVTIDKGTTVEAASFLVYNDPPSLGNNCYSPTYPSKFFPAKLEVNGTLTANEIGGTVTSTVSNAKIEVVKNSARDTDVLYISSTNSYSGSYDDQTLCSVVVELGSSKMTLGGFAFYKATERSLSLPKQADASAYYHTVGTYYSAARTDGTFGWYPTEITVTLDPNGGALTSDSTIKSTLDAGSGFAVNNSITSAPVRDHYDFSHWCTSKTCNASSHSFALYESTTLYAIWTPIPYTVTYHYDSTEIAGEVIPDGATVGNTNPTSFTILTNTPLFDATYASFVFNGWYVDEACKVSVSNLNGPEIVSYLSNGNLNLYSKWHPEGTKFYTINYNNDNTDGFNKTYSGSYVGENIGEYGLLSLTEKNNTTTYTQYFKGWSLTEGGDVITSLKDVTPTEGADTNNPKYTLYAVWGT